jgi:hypothetical protein
MMLVVDVTNQNGLYQKHMFCKKNVKKIQMRKIVSPHDFDSIKKFVRLAATFAQKFARGDTVYYNLDSIFRAFKRKEMKALSRLAEMTSLQGA